MLAEDKVSIRRQEDNKSKAQMPKNLQNATSPTQQNTSANSKSIENAKDRFNVRYKGVQATVYKNAEKRIDQVARKKIRKSTKVKDPKTFEQKYKTIDGKFVTYTLHTAWVQTLGKPPRLLKKPLYYTDRAEPLGLVITSHINLHGDQDHAYVYRH